MSAPLLLVFGTRPDAIKVGPVAAALDERGTPWQGLCSGQHTDLLRGTPVETDLRRAKSLGLTSHGNVMRWLSEAEKAFGKWFRLHGEDVRVVAVQGDTMTALAAARAADAASKKVVHIEAGLRSGDLENPWPEEKTRVEITQLATWHYAPTSKAFANLVAEGIPLARIVTTGNTVVSALARYSVARPSPSLGHVLVTMHRREWLLGPAFMATLETLLEEMGKQPVEFFWPVHPAVRAAGARQFEGAPKNVVLLGPQDYQTFTRLLCSARGVVTDSGGLQEEAATLGVPCAVLRFLSDRPESIEAGVAALFEPTPVGARLAVECVASEFLPRKVAPVFGEPDAATQVAAHLARLVEVE